MIGGRGRCVVLKNLELIGGRGVVLWANLELIGGRGSSAARTLAMRAKKAVASERACMVASFVQVGGKQIAKRATMSNRDIYSYRSRVLRRRHYRHRCHRRTKTPLAGLQNVDSIILRSERLVNIAITIVCS